MIKLVPPIFKSVTSYSLVTVIVSVIEGSFVITLKTTLVIVSVNNLEDLLIVNNVELYVIPLVDEVTSFQLEPPFTEYCHLLKETF